MSYHHAPPSRTSRRRASRPIPPLPAPVVVRPPAAARVVDAVKVYGRGENEVRALDGVSVEFASGRFTAIMGPSGSGKSTLMHSVAGLDHLTSGTVFIGDTERHRTRRPPAHAAAPGPDRVHLPGVQPRPDAHRGGEHRTPRPPRRPQARPRVVRPGRRDRRAAEPPEAPTVGAVRRATTAGRGRTSPRQPPRDRLRRRADRQPRLPHGRRDPVVHAHRGA